MTRSVVCLTAVCLVASAAAAPAQSSLPLVTEVEPGPLREQCRRLVQVLHGTLPDATERKLTEAVGSDKAPEDLPEIVQKLLDPHCLIAVSINPESRVKAARGPHSAELVRGRETLVLIKVFNEAGVTHGLKLSGDQLGKGSDGRGWLEARVATTPPLRRTLSGQKLEYVVLRLQAREAGKREATLKFDVGQGTQDLGFRGEVPVLFTVRPAGR
jgi:hypothetical protein